MSVTARDGTGSSISFSGGFSAKITRFGGPNVEGKDINASCLGTTGGFEEYLPSVLVDGGELDMEIEYSGEVSPPLVNREAETVTITLTGSQTVQFEGYFKSFNMKVAMSEKITADVKVKVAGAVTGL